MTQGTHTGTVQVCMLAAAGARQPEFVGHDCMCLRRGSDLVSLDTTTAREWSSAVALSCAQVISTQRLSAGCKQEPQWLGMVGGQRARDSSSQRGSSGQG